MLEGKIDILATDLIHGGVDGVELIGKVRKRYPKIKILVCIGLLPLPVEVYKYADDCKSSKTLGLKIRFY